MEKKRRTKAGRRCRRRESRPQLSSPRLARSRPREAMSPTVAPMDDATFMHVLKHTLETGLQRKQVITVDVISDPN